MFANIINKQSFEYACKSENTALLVRNNIESYTALRFNTIIESIFEEAVQDNSLLKIDKLEIELGDIYVNDMSKPEIFSKFKGILKQKILDSKKVNIETNGIIESDLFKILPETENEIQFIRFFILSGDVPWWIDKGSKFNIDSIINKLIKYNVETFKNLLKEFTGRRELLLRLVNHTKTSTLLKIWEIQPDLSDIISKELYIGENIYLELEMLSAELLKKRGNSHRRNVDSSLEKLKNNLSYFLPQILDKDFRSDIFLNQIEIITLIASVKNFLNSNDVDERNKIEKALKNLSSFQAELLLFELSNYSANKKYFNSSLPEKDQGSQIQISKDSQAMIAFIMKRLKTSDEVLREYLIQLNSNQLKHLTSLFRKRIKKIKERTQIKEYLLSNPLLFKNGMLQLVAYFSILAKQVPKDGVMNQVKKDLKNNLQKPVALDIKSDKLNFLSALKKLHSKDFIIIRDILQKGKFDTDNERYTIKKNIT